MKLVKSFLPGSLWGAIAFATREEGPESELSLIDRVLSSIDINGTRQDYESCVSNYPLVDITDALSFAPLLNLKTPGEWHRGASIFTSLDRRLPSWTGANINGGATVTRGSINRIKPVGRLGTAAAAVGVFSAAYSTTARYRCLWNVR